MKKSSKISLLSALGIALVLGFFLFLRQPAPSDSVQIQTQIDAATAAASKRDTGGVMRIVSGEYTDGRLNGDRLRLLLIQAFRSSGAIDVTVTPARISVHGDQADSVSTIHVVSHESNGARFDKPVTLRWKREEGRRFLLFPTKVWRVVGAEYEGGFPGEEDSLL